MGTATLLACGAPSNGGSATSPSASPSSSPSALACTTSGAASSAWQTPDRLPATAAIVSATASGDVLTITFVSGTPAYSVTTQSSASFTKDPSGQPVTLNGTAGALIVLHGFRGDVRNFTGAHPITSQGSVLLEVDEVGDNEGVVTWGAGLGAPGCATVTASGSTLTFRFIPQPGA